MILIGLPINPLGLVGESLLVRLVVYLGEFLSEVGLLLGDGIVLVLQVLFQFMLLVLLFPVGALVSEVMVAIDVPRGSAVSGLVALRVVRIAHYIQEVSKGG